MTCSPPDYANEDLSKRDFWCGDDDDNNNENDNDDDRRADWRKR